MIDRDRFPATYHLVLFWSLVPSWIETEDAPGTKVLTAGAHEAEIQHWLWTYRVWNGWVNPRFIPKRIAEMTDAEFKDWCRTTRPGFRAWLAWLTQGVA